MKRGWQRKIDYNYFFTIILLFHLKSDYASVPTPAPTPLCYQGFMESSLSFSTSNIKTPVDITISFRASCLMAGGEQISIRMPHFTRGDANGSLGSSEGFGDLLMTPSLKFRGSWVEGTYNRSYPDVNDYNYSEILIT